LPGYDIGARNDGHIVQVDGIEGFFNTDIWRKDETGIFLGFQFCDSAVIDIEHPDKSIHPVDIRVNPYSCRIVKISPITGAVPVDFHGELIITGIQDGSWSKAIIIDLTSDNMSSKGNVHRTQKKNQA
jgi:hypothetical protein